MAAWDGIVVGAFHAEAVPHVADDAPLEMADGPFRPLAELERLAQGSWILRAMTVFPEYRGMGVGSALLDRACAAGRCAGHNRMAFQVASDTAGALALYRKNGFTEGARRPFVPFAGSEDEGAWILMLRDL